MNASRVPPCSLAGVPPLFRRQMDLLIAALLILILIFDHRSQELQASQVCLDGLLGVAPRLHQRQPAAAPSPSKQAKCYQCMLHWLWIGLREARFDEFELGRHSARSMQTGATAKLTLALCCA